MSEDNGVDQFKPNEQQLEIIKAIKNGDKIAVSRGNQTGHNTFIQYMVDQGIIKKDWYNIELTQECNGYLKLEEVFAVEYWHK